MTSSFLEAFVGKNKRIPAWFMRQAGRYLPAYQTLREKYSLEEMFKTPELAAEVTCMPIKTVGVDAAILFADILTLPTAMGFKISFDGKKGPQILNPIKHAMDLERIENFSQLDYLEETIQCINQQLPKDVPLIGFAGSPFTVMVYLISENESHDINHCIRFAYKEQDAFHRLMEILTRNTIDYLNFQKRSGVKAFQLFDTWAVNLRPSDYAHWVLPYVKKIFEAIDLPSIYYVKNCHHLLALMDQCEADFLSVCHTVVLGHNSILEKTKKGIQGNLFNGLLYADYDVLKKEIRDVLAGGLKHPRYIFNLSHGVLPDTEVDKLKFVVDQVHGFKV